jgi:AcrR family transcriptional regulator
VPDTARHLTLATVAGPKQARSQRTLARLLDAAEALVAERGLEGLSIPAVARRARSSVGGFYARFTDKAALLRALEERFFQQVFTRLEALVDKRRWASATPADFVRAAVCELVTVVEERAPLLKAFMFRASQDPRILEDAIVFRRQVAERIAPVLLGQTLDHPRPALAVDLGIQAAFALMQQHVVFGGTWADGHMLSRAELEREIATLFMRYVGIEPTPSRARRAPVTP